MCTRPTRLSAVLCTSLRLSPLRVVCRSFLLPSPARVPPSTVLVLRFLFGGGARRVAGLCTGLWSPHLAWGVSGARYRRKGASVAACRSPAKGVTPAGATPRLRRPGVGKLRGSRLGHRAAGRARPVDVTHPRGWSPTVARRMRRAADPRVRRSRCPPYLAMGGLWNGVSPDSVRGPGFTPGT